MLQDKERTPHSESSPEIYLDLPAPISVNRLRRIDWSAEVRNTAWKQAADALVLVAKRRRSHPLKLERITRFEVTLIFDEAVTGIDLDNGIKGLLDFLVDREVIFDDGPKHMRKLTIVWGDSSNAPEGTRVIVRPLQ